jgi:hypothetical protein
MAKSNASSKKTNLPSSNWISSKPLITVVKILGEVAVVAVVETTRMVALATLLQI